MKRTIALLALALPATIPTTADAGSACVTVIVATISTYLQAGHCVSTPGDSICTFLDHSRPSAYVAVTICVPDPVHPPPA